MKEYQRLQKEILEKRRAKTRERVRRVMKRMERARFRLNLRICGTCFPWSCPPTG